MKNSLIIIFIIIVINLSAFTYDRIFDSRMVLKAHNDLLSICSGDLNGDGYIDLVSVDFWSPDYSSENIYVYFNHGNGTFGEPESHYIGYSPTCCLMVDLENDNDSDMVVVNDSGVCILYNDGFGSFPSRTTFPASVEPRQGTIADINDDGYQDLLISCSHSPGNGAVSVLLNGGDGSFTIHENVATVGFPYFIAAADFDGDDDLDMAVTCELPDTVLIYKNDGVGNFTYFSGCYTYSSGNIPIGICTEDFDGDDDNDLAVCLYYSSRLLIYSNNGDANFTISNNYDLGDGATTVSAGDLDNDNDIDLVATGGAQYDITVCLNDGAGQFNDRSEYKFVGASRELTLAYLNGDNFLDIGGVGYEMSTLMNTGDGRFIDCPYYPTGAGPKDAVVADFDDDGFDDIAVCSYGDMILSFYFNDGNHIFNDTSYFDIDYAPNGLAAGDYDNDDDIDLAVACDNNSYIYLNDGTGNLNNPVQVGTGTLYTKVIETDLDYDTDLDLVFQKDAAENIEIYLNDGVGNFGSGINYTIGTKEFGAVTAFMNSDLYPDIIVPAGDSIALALNDGSGSFTEILMYGAGKSVGTIATIDFNLDGPLDVAVANRLVDSMHVLFNGGEGNLSVPFPHYVPCWPMDMFAADYDLDGTRDIATVCNSSDDIHFWVNGYGNDFSEWHRYGTQDRPVAFCNHDIDKNGSLDIVAVNYGSATISVMFNSHSGTIDCGDLNDDEQINLLDVTFLISFLYMGGTAPDPLEIADVDSSGVVNILDITSLIVYLYDDGPEPNCPQ